MFPLLKPDFYSSFFFKAHENNCLFVRVRCTNDHCDVVLLKTDLQRHLTQECPQRTVSCQYCQQNYIWRLEQVHIF